MNSWTLHLQVFSLCCVYFDSKKQYDLHRKIFYFCNWNHQEDRIWDFVFAFPSAQILDFHNVLSWASCGMIRSCCMSLRTQSIHLPLGLFPGTIMSTIALTSLFSSILWICPYQHSLNSQIFCFMLSTPSSFLMSTSLTVWGLCLGCLWRLLLFLSCYWLSLQFSRC